MIPTGPLQALGRGLCREDDLGPSDVIVVLGGDAAHRAPHGAALYHLGLAPRLLAVGGLAARGTKTEAHRTARVLRLRGVPEHAIETLGQDEPNTVGEARATARLAAARGWRRLIVVSSPYHCWRAGLVFERALRGLDAEVLLAPSPFEGFDPDAWWTEARRRRQVRNELLRYGWWRVVRLVR